MSRAHLRHIVANRNGDVIENALVHVYEPGTTTPVADMYAAASGGSPITTLTSNDQGEISGWFAQSQLVDLKVTDNTDGASLPGVAGTISFAEWTEEDIEVPPPVGTYRPVHDDAIDITAAPYSATSGSDLGALIQDAHDDLPAGGGAISIPAGDWMLSTRVNISKPVRIFGAGVDQTTITGGVDSDYMFLRQGTSDVAGIEFSDLTLDLDNGTARSAIRVEYVSRFAMRRVRIANIAQWGLVVGVMDGADSELRNDQILVEDCTFDTSSATYEQLLLFNSINVTVRGSRFEGIGTLAHGVGLYQLLDGVLFDDCWFAGDGKGAYYSLSTNNIRFRDCRFLSGVGIQGANQADNGAFGATFVRNLSLIGCLFSTIGAYGCQLGAVSGGSVVDCDFYRCEEVGLVISPGNSPVNTAPENLSILGCRFRENNQAATSAALHPALLVQTGMSTDLNLFVVACEFEDDQGPTTQTFPISFSGAVTYNKVSIIGNRLKAGTGGVSIVMEGSAALGAAVDIVANRDFTGAGLGGEVERARLGGETGSLLGFFGTAPAAKPTGVAVSAAGIHAALVTLGLISA